MQRSTQPGNEAASGWEAFVSVTPPGFKPEAFIGPDWESAFVAGSKYLLDELQKSASAFTTEESARGAGPEFVLISAIVWRPDPSRTRGRPCTLRVDQLLLVDGDTLP